MLVLESLGLGPFRSKPKVCWSLVETQDYSELWWTMTGITKLSILFEQ